MADKTPAWEAEYDVVRQLLSHAYVPLHFPAHLEQSFRDTMRARSLATLREYFWMLYVLGVLVVLVMFFQYTVNGVWIGAIRDLHLTLAISGVVTAGTVALWLLVRVNSLDKWFLHYFSAVTLLLLIALTVLPGFFLDVELRQSSTYLVIYILMMVYGVSSLRVQEAALIGFVGLVVVAYLLSILPLMADWGTFMQFFVLTNLVGVGNCYVMESRERRLFLQGHLLELEKQQLNKLSERLVQLSREDGLTGLANRRHFNERFLTEWERARRERQPLALVFADVDFFKAYNDKHGHLDGDQALISVAHAIEAVATRPGDLAARYGGEEFVLLLPNTDCQGAEALARELLRMVDRKQIAHRASSVANHVTVSAGVAALIPDVHIAPAKLIDLADTALYQAKAQGRHQVVVSTLC